MTKNFRFMLSALIAGILVPYSAYAHVDGSAHSHPHSLVSQLLLLGLIVVLTGIGLGIALLKKGRKLR